MNNYYNSIYKKDLVEPEVFPSLKNNIECDVSIVGGGFTGLSSAIELAQAGLKVCIFEKEYIGYGASGRNGGHLVQGWSTDFYKLQKSINKNDHKMAWDAGIEAVEIVTNRIKKYNIKCDLQMGYVYAALHKRHLSELIEMKQEWSNFGYKNLEVLGNKKNLQKYVNTDRYIGGLVDTGSGHLHPMKYLHSLAKIAKNLGVRIFEKTFIIERHDNATVLKTSESFEIKSSKILFCGNAYLEGVSSKRMTDKLAPAISSVMATKPLPKSLIQNLIPENCAVADCNTALNYYRFDSNDRLIFGGSSIYSNISPKDATPGLYKKMVYLFPSLKNIDIEMSWSGKIGITLSRIPHFGKLNKDVLFTQGYSGHGVALTALAGKLMSEDILGKTNRFETLSKISHLTFPGGIFRTPVLALGMSWFKFKDWLRI